MADVEGAIFVDGANWAYPLLGGRINFDWLVSRLQKATGIKLVGFYYYTAFRTKEDLERRWAFLNYLKDLGWQVQAMPATQGADGQWRDKEVDIAIALDAYEEARSGRAKAIILGSGDQDFAALFRRLPDEVDRWAVGFRAHMSPVLGDVAHILFLDDLGVVQSRPPSMGGADECLTGEELAWAEKRLSRKPVR